MELVLTKRKQTYLFFQFQYLLPNATIPEIATYIGITYAARTIAKVCTGVLWGRVADSRWGGRKLVLLIGLLSTCNANPLHNIARLI